MECIVEQETGENKNWPVKSGMKIVMKALQFASSLIQLICQK